MSAYLQDPDLTLWHGDALDVLRNGVEYDAIVTSPPYLDARPEYGSPDAQWWDEFFAVAHGPALINVGRLWRDGQESDWWMRLLGYAKANGWKHRDTLVWAKPNANPIHGEVLSNSHEYVLLLGDGFNVDGVRRPHAESTVARFGRAWTNHRGVKAPRDSRARKTRAAPNPAGALPRSYIEFCVGREKGNPHPAPMALQLAEHLVKLACPVGGVVLDPFAGSGTTAIAARKHARRSVLVELSQSYCELAASRWAGGPVTANAGDPASRPSQLSLLTGKETG